MKKKYLTLTILLGVSCLLMSCGGLKFIPKGSQSLGVYEGSYTGDLWGGTLRMHLFQTPEGAKLFVANFDGPNDPLWITQFFVRGKITANSLEGEIQGESNGTITGQMSSDGSQLTGSLNVTNPDPNKGTWQAQKK
jgi:hypothetical protein